MTYEKLCATIPNPKPCPLALWTMQLRLQRELKCSIADIDAMEHERFLWYLAIFEAEDAKLEKEQEKLNHPKSR